MDSLTQVFFTILGWLLGILTAPIVSRVMRRYQRGDLRSVICSELKALAIKLAGSKFLIDTHLGETRETSFQLIKSVLTNYKDGSYTDETIEHIKDLDYSTYQAYVIAKKASGKYLSVKAFSIPFINSIVGELSVFNREFQQKIILIFNKVTTLNEEVVASVNLSRLTFTVQEPNNHAIITHNLELSYKYIGDQIDELLTKVIDFLERCCS